MTPSLAAGGVDRATGAPLLRHASDAAGAALSTTERKTLLLQTGKHSATAANNSTNSGDSSDEDDAAAGDAPPADWIPVSQYEGRLPAPAAAVAAAARQARRDDVMRKYALAPTVHLPRGQSFVYPPPPLRSNPRAVAAEAAARSSARPGHLVGARGAVTLTSATPVAEAPGAPLGALSVGEAAKLVRLQKTYMAQKRLAEEAQQQMQQQQQQAAQTGQVPDVLPPIQGTRF